MRPVHPDRREGHPHGLQNVVDFSFVADCIRIFFGDIRGARDDLALDRIEDADAAVPVDEVDHVVSGRRRQFGMVQHHVGTLGAADEAGIASQAAIGEIDPGAGGVDDDLRSHFAGLAGDLVAHDDGAARGALKPDVIQRARLGACGFGVLNQFQAQPFGIRDLGIVVSRGADHFGVQRRPQFERRRLHAEPVSRQRGLAAGQKVVPHQAGLDEQRSPIARLGGPSQHIPNGRKNPRRPTENRDRGGQRLDVVGRVFQ